MRVCILNCHPGSAFLCPGHTDLGDKETHTILIKEHSYSGDGCRPNHVHNEFCTETVTETLHRLEAALHFTSTESPQVLPVLLVGPEAAGETMVIRGALSQGQGRDLQDAVPDAVHTTSHHVNQMATEARWR